MRRTIGFVRSAFVFAVTWSFGALLEPESRQKFDEWFRQRIENLKWMHFPYMEEDDYQPTLWEIYVSFHTMSLRPFSETEKEYQSDDNAVHATDQAMIIPFDQFRMTRYMWQVCLHTRYSS